MENNNINEETRREEELLNTIKMEPIIEKTEIKEEVEVIKKKKMMQLTDYILLALIVIIIIVFIVVVINIGWWNIKWKEDLL